MAECITLAEVLQTMENVTANGKPVPFSIECISCDEAKDDGGDLMKFDKATLAFVSKTGTRQFQHSRRLAELEKLDKQGKAPNHVKNGTINIKNESGSITKLHIWLITKFNGNKVIWHQHG